MGRRTLSDEEKELREQRKKRSRKQRLLLEKTEQRTSLSWILMIQ